MNDEQGGEDMNANSGISVLAVPCDRVMMVSREQGEKILREVEKSRPDEKTKERIRAEMEALRRKPDKK